MNNKGTKLGLPEWLRQGKKDEEVEQLVKAAEKLGEAKAILARLAATKDSHSTAISLYGQMAVVAHCLQKVAISHNALSHGRQSPVDGYQASKDLVTAAEHIKMMH